MYYRIIELKWVWICCIIRRANHSIWG